LSRPVPSAFFYTLVSRDTKENLYATKRQRFLVDQGYSFKVVSELPDIANIPDLQFSSKAEQITLLAEIMATNENDGQEEEQDEDPFARQQKAKNKRVQAVRRTGNALAVTGASDRAYHEYEEGAAAAAAAGGGARAKLQRSDLFRRREEQNKEDAKRR
jgi:DNA excision repair protein ERCC-3